MPATHDMSRQEFEGLLEPLMNPLFGYALRMTGNHSDAEDVLQESIFLAFRGRGGFRKGTHFKAWMFRIVTNTFISRRRRDKRSPVTVDLDAVQDPEAAVETELADAATDWDRLYGDLVEDDVKHALGDLRYKEIGEILEIPVGTVMSRLFRARQRLRHSLRDYARDRGIDIEAGKEA